VGKKHRKKEQTQSEPLAPAKFSVGTIVRVKPGTMDADYNDMPIGGWIGTIQEVDQRSHPILYLVVWNQETLDQMPLVYHKRCERDGLEMENMWLAEDELDLDTGEAAKTEQPTVLVSRSLSTDDGEVSTSSEWIRLEISPYPVKKSTLFGSVIWGGIAGTVIGIPLGSLLAAMEVVQMGAIVGAVLVGFLGYWVGTRYGMLFGAVNRLKHGSLYGGIVGVIAGGTLGALIGALLGAVVGIVVGTLIGAVISKWFLRGGKRILGVALGAAAGAILQAFYFDQEKAMTGAIYGAIVGFAAGIVIVLTIYGLLTWLKLRQNHS
jgi:hypothetical protein